MANPRLLAKDTSSGDDGCPSIWLEDGEFTVLGPAADLAGLQNVLPGETAARISIDVVRRALAAYDQEAGGVSTIITREEMRRLLAGFEHTAYRLELLPAYAEDSEATALAAFTEGRQPEVYPGKRGWLEKVRAATDAGKVVQRVHVVTEPLSAYLKFEIGWSYDLNYHEAGEDIRILAASRAPAEVTAAGDYWLLDSRVLIRMGYDDEGRLAVIEHVTSPDMIVAANHARDAALHHAVPLDKYMERQLQRAS